MVRIFHTADVHLGLKFVRSSLSEIRSALVDARLQTLNHMVNLAMEHQCELFVIAGDLFDNLRVPKQLIRQAAETLRRFDGMVVVLPGNHDYVQERSEDPLWPAFMDALGEEHLLLDNPKLYDLRAYHYPVVLYAGPCTTRHSKANALRWLHEASSERAEDCCHIGIAHGSLEGLSPDFKQDYFPMTHSELKKFNMHAWLLGHTHIRYPDEDKGNAARIFYPSVPEPDGFDCRHPGYAWILDINPTGEVHYESIRTGTYRFFDEERTLQGELEIAALDKWLSERSPTSDLVKLELTGRLDDASREMLLQLCNRAKQSALHLEFDDSGVLQRIDQRILDAEFTKDSFPHRLCSALANDPSDALALQLAYELIREVRS